MRYEFRKDFNLLSFLKAIDQCTGDVVFESGQGDRMDLKSQLCKILLLTMKPGDPALQSSRIECSGEDGGRLSEYLTATE